MSVLYGYFAATDDDDAVRAVVRDDGEPGGTGYDQLVINGIDPVVALTPAEALITGRPDAAVRDDPRHGSLVGMVGDGELVVVSLTDTFRDALASCEASSFRDIASAWSTTEDVFSHPADPDALAHFLTSLSALATRAASRPAHLYCWICP